jgi:hypothetical protein
MFPTRTEDGCVNPEEDDMRRLFHSTALAVIVMALVAVAGAARAFRASRDGSRS